MYSAEDLSKYKYFDGADINFVLDSLTGIISRQYILDFARTLVDSNTPFAMSMMDLDNLKYINDNYWHAAGDICLKTIAENLQKCVGEDGLVGRFGGDEFIIIYLKSNKYDDVHDFLARVHAVDQSGAVRRFIYVDKVRLFITGTTGSASFPLDATDYNDLFNKMDKALYRGKSKGRNCYIVYVHEKHKDIVVSDRGGNSLLTKVMDLKAIIEQSSDEEVINKAVSQIHSVLHPAKTFYVNKKNDVYNARENTNYHFGNNMFFALNKMVGKKDIYYSSNPKDVKERFPDVIDYMNANRIHALVIVRVADLGFIALYEDALTSMWKDYDLVLLEVSATLLGYRLKK